MSKITGVVKSVESKVSRDGTKTYYRLNIPVDGKDRWYTSFDAKVLELAGKALSFEAQQTQYGWRLDNYEIQTNPATTKTAQQSSGRPVQEQAFIAAQALTKSGIEAGYYQNMQEARKDLWNNYSYSKKLLETDDPDEIYAILEMFEAESVFDGPFFTDTQTDTNTVEGDLLA